MTRCDACRYLVPVITFTGSAFLCTPCLRARTALKGADLERAR